MIGPDTAAVRGPDSPAGRNPIQRKPVCVGSGLVTLDVIYDGKSETPRFFAGGSCCNVLTILAYLGWDSFPVAVLGTDPEGSRIISDMEEHGVSTEFVKRDVGVQSPRIIQRITGDRMPGHRFHLKCKHGVWLPRRRPTTINHLRTIQDTLPRPDVFYFDRADPSALRSAIMFKERGALVVFEPPRLHCDRTFVRCLEVADIVKHCHARPQASNCPDVHAPLEIQTRGEEGLAYKARFLGQDDWVEMKAFSVARLVDAAGSGDWLTSGLLHSLRANGQKLAASVTELESALEFGQALAAINCSFVGARGTMRHCGRAQVLSMVDNLVSGGVQLRDMLSDTCNEPAQHSTCRVCLCHSGDTHA